MQQVIEGMMGIFFATIVVFIGLEIGEAIAKESEALSYKTQIIRVLEDSDYDAAVIKACFEEAKQKGYELKVILYMDQGNTIELSEANTDRDMKDGVCMSKVLLRYPFEVKILKVFQWFETTGVAC